MWAGAVRRSTRYFSCLRSPTGPTTWRSGSPRCRTSSNKQRASPKGPEKQVRSAGGGPRSTFLPTTPSLKQTHVSPRIHWLMLYSCRRRTAEREWCIFFTFSCVKKHPVSVHTASGSLPVHTFSSFYCRLVLFFTSVILNPLFPRPRDSGDGVCEGCVWDRPGQIPGWVLQNEEYSLGNRRQRHNRLGSLARHQGCQWVSAFQCADTLLP